MRAILLRPSAIVLYLICAPLVAAETEIMTSVPGAALGNNTFYTPAGSQSNGSENLVQFPCNVPGTFSNLRVFINAAPGNGSSRIVTFMLNGSTTSLTCTISGAQTFCEDVKNSVSVTNGSLVDYKHTTSGGPAAANGGFSIMLTSTASQDTILGNFGASGTTNNFAFADSGTFNATETTADKILPIGGTIQNLYVISTAAPGTGKSFAFTIRKNDANGSPNITCTISGNETACRDSVNTFSVVATDKLNLQSVPTGTPTTGQKKYVMSFVPSTKDYFTILGRCGLLGTNNRFFGLHVAASSPDATESNIQAPSQRMILGNLIVDSSAAPGAGNSMSVTLRQNATNTSLTCTLSATQTRCTDQNSVDRYVANATPNTPLSFLVTSTGSPGGLNTRVSLTGLIPSRRFLVE